ncbi:hypothetical protein KIPB_012628, partial [Kipferlia bialata]|eukprot:g12628.t1
MAEDKLPRTSVTVKIVKFLFVLLSLGFLFSTVACEACVLVRWGALPPMLMDLIAPMVAKVEECPVWLNRIEFVGLVGLLFQLI